MGRHSAPAAFDEPSRTTGPLAVPITDPLLLDEVAAGLKKQRKVPAEPVIVRPSVGRPVALHPGHASTAEVAEHNRQRAPRAVAPMQLPQPRAATTHSATLAFSDVPLDVRPRLLAVALTTAPIPTRTPLGIPSSGARPLVPRAPRRHAAIAACALALLGVVSAAAMVLPTPADAVQATDAKHSDPAVTSDSAPPSVAGRAAEAHQRASHPRLRQRVHYVHWSLLGLQFSMPTPSMTTEGRPSAVPTANAEANAETTADATASSSEPTSSSATPSPSASTATPSKSSKPREATSKPSAAVTVPAAPAVGSSGSSGGFVVGATKPTAQNTGAGVIRPYPTKVINGDVTLTGNESLKDTIVHGRVSVKGTNNVVENCVITGPVDRGYTGYVWLVNTSSATNATVRFNTIRAAHTSAYVNGIGLKNVTAERNDISRVIDGFDIDKGSSGDTDVHTTIRANYIHDLMFFGADPNHSTTPTPSWYTGAWARKPWSHDDGIQITSGTGLSVVGNTIDASWAGDIGTLPLPSFVAELSSMMITAKRGPITGLSVRDNWFDGGAYSINAGGAAGSGTFIGNRFGRHIQGSGNNSFTLVFDSKFAATTSDNTYEDSGAAVQVRRNF